MMIIPSILVKSEAEFRHQITAVAESVPMVQIDIADGEFVPSTTWASPEVAEEVLTVPAELHLMVKDPLSVARSWKEVHRVTRCLVHVESVPDLHPVIRELAGFGWEVSLVLNPETQLERVEPYLNEIQGIMLMGVRPGGQGQPFIPATLERAKHCKLKYPTHFLEVDGGVNEDTLPGLLESGVDAVCPGSAIFGNERTPKDNVARLEKLISGLTR